MNDEEFREKFQPLQVPAHYDPQAAVTEQTLFALAQLGEATADEVVAKLKELQGGDATAKPLISGVHETLSEWYDNGLIAARESGGDLRYNLQKVTEGNDGRVDPEKLAPWLD